MSRSSKKWGLKSAAVSVISVASDVEERMGGAPTHPSEGLEQQSCAHWGCPRCGTITVRKATAQGLLQNGKGAGASRHCKPALLTAAIHHPRAVFGSR